MASFARKSSWKALLLGVSALILFTIRLASYSDYIYDERCYVPSARAFLNGSTDTNPEHPPLGKLIIALSMKVFGDNSFGWRFASAVAGSLTVVGIFYLALVLFENSSLAVLAGLLAILNHFTFVMARAAMLEAFIMMFSVAGVAAWVAAVRGIYSRPMLAASGVLLGCAVAVKWSALVIVVVLILATAGRWAKKESFAAPWYIVSCLVVLPVMTYCLSFWPLFHSQHVAFSLAEIMQRDRFILEYHRHAIGALTANSFWYQWPFRTTPDRGLSYMVGNWAVCWTGLAAMVVCAYRFARRPHLADGLIVALFGATWLQWALIHRPFSYYYYYSIPATFLCLALPAALRTAPGYKILGVRVALVNIVAAAMIFLIFYPVMTGLGPPWDCAVVCIGAAIWR